MGDNKVTIETLLGKFPSDNAMATISEPLDGEKLHLDRTLKK
jgi:hypothetical protein